MPTLAANLTLLFTEVPFLDRVERAARAGFRAVECQFPYDHTAAAVRDRLETYGLRLVLHNLPAGNWAEGERGIACLPDRVREFNEAVDRAIEYAVALNCPTVNCLAGIRPDDLAPQQAHDTFVDNLRSAAPRFQAAGIGLVIEAINTRDVPGFFLSGSAQALQIIDALTPGSVRFQLDAYHLHVMGEDVIETLERCAPHVGHVQIADAPGRHEPGTGVIAYPQFLGLLDRLGYAGWIGCEYLPTASTEAGLRWATRYLKTDP